MHPFQEGDEAREIVPNPHRSFSGAGLYLLSSTARSLDRAIRPTGLPTMSFVLHRSIVGRYHSSIVFRDCIFGPVASGLYLEPRPALHAGRRYGG
jgi:hypothetical protein